MDEVEARPITDDDLNELISGVVPPAPGTLRPHPATGWMAVEKIKGSLILPPMDEEEMKGMAIQTPMGTLQMEPIPQNQRVGIIGAKVIEVGKLPPSMEETFEWKDGDTIYMASDRGIDVGDFTLVMIDKVICFTKADENGD